MKSYLDIFKGKRCDVLGFGVSNIPLVNLLIGAGAKVTVRDKKSAEQLGDIIKGIDAEFILGENYLDGIDADMIFRSPGVKPFEKGILDALARGIPMTSEMEFFIKNTPAKVIGITGSDGKTTTTTITSLLLEKQVERQGRGKVYVGGNIGVPLLQYIDEMTKDDYAVVELSSFQLENITVSPERAVITNISPNHLNWHPDMDDYIQAKRRVCAYPGCKWFVTNAECDITKKIYEEMKLPGATFSSKRADAGMISEIDGAICFMGEKVLDVGDIKIRGRHNVENYMAAIGVTWGLVDKDMIREIARTFAGVEHRIEFVRELNGVKYFNSSIDSSPSRTIAALLSFDEKPIVICGGQDKHVPFDPLAETLCKRAKAVVLTGEAMPQILTAIKACPLYDPEKLPVHIENDFREAVLYACFEAVTGDTVLLSPACTSFDAFRNFEERGKYFKKIINELK